MAILVSFSAILVMMMTMYSQLAIASIRPLACACTLSGYFESTLCPKLDVVNPSYFASNSSFFHDSGSSPAGLMVSTRTAPGKLHIST